MSQDIRPRVFVVDDESVIASTLGQILRQKGFDAYAFKQPLEALRTSREMAPDLLITDVMMPVLTGIELAIQMREHNPCCKVLLISGHPGTADLLVKARANSQDFESLAKPMHPAQLLEKIRTVLDA